MKFMLLTRLSEMFVKRRQDWKANHSTTMLGKAILHAIANQYPAYMQNTSLLDHHVVFIEFPDSVVLVDQGFCLIYIISITNILRLY